MTVVVSGKAKFTQAQGSLGRDLFQAYDCDEEAKFGINLTTLLECLQIYGPGSLSQTSVSMAYEEVGARRQRCPSPEACPSLGSPARTRPAASAPTAARHRFLDNSLAAGPFARGDAQWDGRSALGGREGRQLFSCCRMYSVSPGGPQLWENVSLCSLRQTLFLWAPSHITSSAPPWFRWKYCGGN